jgi:hypothetical protein
VPQVDFDELLCMRFKRLLLIASVFCSEIPHLASWTVPTDACLGCIACLTGTRKGYFCTINGAQTHDILTAQEHHS